MRFLLLSRLLIFIIYKYMYLTAFLSLAVHVARLVTPPGSPFKLLSWGAGILRRYGKRGVPSFLSTVSIKGTLSPKLATCWVTVNLPTGLLYSTRATLFLFVAVVSKLRPCRAHSRCSEITTEGITKDSGKSMLSYVPCPPL